MGWGGVGYSRSCALLAHVDAALLLRQWLGVRWGGVGWDTNVHVPCVHTWMLRCCYVSG